jgi:hypothetical protein
MLFIQKYIKKTTEEIKDSLVNLISESSDTLMDTIKNQNEKICKLENTIKQLLEILNLEQEDYVDVHIGWWSGTTKEIAQRLVKKSKKSKKQSRT